jgi:hypothetical protein
MINAIKILRFLPMIVSIVLVGLFSFLMLVSSKMSINSRINSSEYFLPKYDFLILVNLVVGVLVYRKKRSFLILFIVLTLFAYYLFFNIYSRMAPW